MGSGTKVKRVIEREYKGSALRKIWERRHKAKIGSRYDDVLNEESPLYAAVTFYILSGEHKNTRFPPKPVVLINYGQYQLRLIADDAIDFIKFFGELEGLAQEYADEMNDMASIQLDKYLNRIDRERNRIKKQIRKIN
jgi:hypothetical protein